MMYAISPRAKKPGSEFTMKLHGFKWDFDLTHPQFDIGSFLAQILRVKLTHKLVRTRGPGPGIPVDSDPRESYYIDVNHLNLIKF